MILTARQKIFSYIRKHQAVTAAEIARDLNMTAANARHHLGILRKNGQVAVIAKRSAGTRGGRPCLVYGLSRHMLGDGLPALSHHLLGEMLESVNARQRASLLEKLGKRLSGSCTRGASPSPMIRLAETVKQLNRLGYRSRWEAHATGPRIILEHCPYAAIIRQHPELCEMDAALLRNCLDGAVEQIAKLEGDEGRVCVFRAG
jgi:predicted ArsR family transcriptional regulator